MLASRGLVLQIGGGTTGALPCWILRTFRLQNQGGTRSAGTASHFAPIAVRFPGSLALVAQLKNRHKRFLRDIHIAHRLHALFALFLLLEELALSRDVATITLGNNILA